MNKRDIIASVSKKTGFTIENADTAVTATIEAIRDAMLSGKKIQLLELGVFEPVERAPRIGRNPASGEAIQIPARKAYKFKLSTKIKRVLND